MKPEAVGCSLSNASCDGDVPDKIESLRNNNTLVSSTSLINVPKLSMFEVSFLRGSPATTGMVTYLRIFLVSVDSKVFFLFYLGELFFMDIL